MKIRNVALAILSVSTAISAKAVDLPDCQFGSMHRSKLFQSVNATTVVDVKGELRNGEVIAYEKNDAILVVEMTTTQVLPAFTPSTNVEIKSSWMMSPNYRLEGGKQIDLPVQVKNPAGRSFYAVQMGNMMIFMDDAGNFCNRAFNYGSETQVWAMGVLSQTASVPVDFKVIERPGKSIGMRVIFNGINAGQISFQEVWVNGATVLNSQTRNFDQFAKDISIGPFKFNVLGTAGEKIKLKYDISTRFEPTDEQFSRMR